jgi:hypothetical protein
MRFGLVLLLLGACGDDASLPAVDGGGSGSDADASPLELAVEFAPLPLNPAGGPVTGHIVGADARIWGVRDSKVVASSDAGASWTSIGAQPAQDVASTSSAVFAFTPGFNGNTPKLARANSASSYQFAAITAPTNALAIAASTDRVWIETYEGNGLSLPKLFVSTDAQATAFTEVTLPPPTTSNRWSLLVGGAYLFAVSQGHVYRTQTANVWDDLGTVAFVPLPQVFATQAGTVFAVGSGTGFLRRTVSDSGWNPQTVTPLYNVSQRLNGELVRVDIQTGAYETSTTDGASWTAGPTVSLTSCEILEQHAFDTAILGTCHDGAATFGIRLASAATPQWTLDEPDGLSGSMRDVSFGDHGLVVMASTQRAFISHDAGAHWQRGTARFDTTNPITAIAVTPDGTRMFAGSTIGRWAWLDANGGVIVASTLAPAAQHVRAAHWMSDQIIWVTTASDDDTEGQLLNGDPDRIGTWEPVNPLRNETNPQTIQPAGYHGVEACRSGSDYTIVVGAKEWLGTNNYETKIQIQFRLGTDGFQSIDPPFTPQTITSFSCAPNGTQSMTIGDDFLYVGNFIGPQFRRIEASGLQGKLLSAKFGPDNRLWVITTFGVFRSVAPVDGH